MLFCFILLEAGSCLSYLPLCVFVHLYKHSIWHMCIYIYICVCVHFLVYIYVYYVYIYIIVCIALFPGEANDGQQRNRILDENHGF